uniref:Uncharacterized protein n=1 Tax=Podoviridae sp. ctZkC8 TaxID=2825259 RepID=A0A8S5UBN4_9CAUD|nr:MAG TPA: hypothetical protein [Podoviridae sp. ctZkC8]DAQ63962.1 MAG TPA: hypothetical protein [Caudoviricetes sp.]DAT39743.1 MAG TPA: hypothetical protein [Caudoviricetes sp.]
MKIYLFSYRSLGWSIAPNCGQAISTMRVTRL